MKIMPVALEDGVLGHREENIKIAIGPAIGSRRAFARKPDAGAFLDARRHIHGKRAFLLYLARAAAGLAGMADDLARAAALGAAALDGEEALAGAHLAVTGAGGTGFGVVARFRARTVADIAGHHGRHLDSARFGP